jgi:hypothetical protein
MQSKVEDRDRGSRGRGSQPKDAGETPISQSVPENVVGSVNGIFNQFWHSLRRLNG